MNKWLWIGAVAVLAAGGAWWAMRPAPQAPGQVGRPTGAAPAAATASGEMVAVTVPELTGAALRGQQYFQAKCAVCHGPNAGGQEGKAPPLVHQYYRPAHHGDMAIRLAARRGVTSHHWRFGNMPPIEGLTDADLNDIIAFIRAVQRANGIS